MRIFWPAAVVVIGGVLGVPAAGWGQYSSGMSGGMSSGTSGVGSTSSTGSSGTTFANRSLGSGVSAGNRSFASGSSTGGSGMRGMGASGGSGTPGAMTGNVGQVDSGTRFMNAQRGNFVGADSRDMSNILGGVLSGQGANQRGAMSNSNMMRSSGAMQQLGLGQGGMNRLGGNYGGANFGGANFGGLGASRELPTTLRKGFDHPQPAFARISSDLGQRMSEMQGLHSRSPLKVMVQDGTATLKGVVATEHDRAVAARVVLLEPGVWRVKNELVVASPAAGSAPARPEAAN